MGCFLVGGDQMRLYVIVAMWALWFAIEPLSAIAATLFFWAYVWIEDSRC